MKLNTFILCSLILSSGCVNASVLEPNVCGEVPLIETQTNDSSVEFTGNFDFSPTVNNINNIANDLTINVNELTIDDPNSLKWIEKADVFISNKDTTPVLFASYHSENDINNHLNVQVVMDSNSMLKYFSLPVILTVIISGNVPTNNIRLKNIMCIEVNATINKTL